MRLHHWQQPGESKLLGLSAASISLRLLLSPLSTLVYLSHCVARDEPACVHVARAG